jgi:hypothetical protein
MDRREARKEAAMKASNDEGVTPRVRSTEELRAEMLRILDEIPSARAERTSALSAEFKALWNQIGGDDPTLH